MKKTDLPPHLMSSKPEVHPDAFVAKGAILVGSVVLKKEASVWYNAVLRADINRITVGERSNIQDGCVCHLENEAGCTIGNDVTVGHNAILHGCTIEDGALIGMGAIILNGAVIGRGAMVGAGSLVRENMIVPPYALVVGIPAKVIRTSDESQYEKHVAWAKKYVALSTCHRNLPDGYIYS